MLAVEPTEYGVVLRPRPSSSKVDATFWHRDRATGEPVEDEPVLASLGPSNKNHRIAVGIEGATYEFWIDVGSGTDSGTSFWALGFSCGDVGERDSPFDGPTTLALANLATRDCRDVPCVHRVHVDFVSDTIFGVSSRYLKIGGRSGDLAADIVRLENSLYHCETTVAWKLVSEDRWYLWDPEMEVNGTQGPVKWSKNAAQSK